MMDIPFPPAGASEPSGQRSVIKGKLAPPQVAEHALIRPRVSALLCDLVEHQPVVWVCATAGAGKTTAVVHMLDSSDRQVAWLTIDETDAAPGRLLTYLESAIARRIPAVRDVATGALAARIPHAEAAGLLAEAVGEVPLLLIIDGLERLAGGGAEQARAVLTAFLRYALPTTRVILISRLELPLGMGRPDSLARPTAVGESDLALTPDEAAQVLSKAGQSSIDAERAVAVSGGWVTGVLFETWRSPDHVVGVGGEADPLHGYLASEILEQLDPGEREFLEKTSLLDLVTPARAEALGLPGAGDRLVALRAKHIPVSWVPRGYGMRCHPRFREYLIERLERRGAVEVRKARQVYGELLMAEGLYEEAVEEFLRADVPERALAAADMAIESVIARLDFGVAERWLEALRHVMPLDAKRLVAAELMLAIGCEDFGRGGRIADRLLAAGARESVARGSSMAASVMAWCYWHLGKIEDARAVLDVASPSPEVDASHYLLSLVRTEAGIGEPFTPVLDGGALDALVMRVHYAHGRLPEVAMAPTSPWAAGVSAPWRIGALRAMGRLEEALKLYRRAPETSWSQAWMHGIVGAELKIDLGEPREAREQLARGRVLIRRSGSVVFEILNRLIEAKLELRLHRDPEAAVGILSQLEARDDARRYQFIAEQIDTWWGLASLMSGANADARDRLARAVESMVAARRILELPTAAVLLSEAQWRMGCEELADQAADLALGAAQRQGSNHHLLQALADFPDVLSRALDAEPVADSPWHDVARALMARGVCLQTEQATTVSLSEFGQLTITVDGREARPRITKSALLLAYLASAPGHAAEREELLGALFDGRGDESARAYLRQAAHRLREALPDIGPSFCRNRLQFDRPVVLRSESFVFESLLARAAPLVGAARLAVLTEALEIPAIGEYLPGVDTTWAKERRGRLADLAVGAALDAAQLAFADGKYRDAQRLVELTLEKDPYKESGWRLLMRIAHATGDEDRVIAVYHQCQQALDSLDAAPSPSTQQLLAQLRR